jgi:SAM-dependent methyltransferase
MSNEAKNVTSERLSVENCGKTAEGFLIYVIHIVAYRWFLQDCSGKAVLDFGCGTGYGTRELSTVTKSCHGVDVSQEAISHCQNAYNDSGIEFTQIQPIEESPLPFPDASFDVVVSNQVIEHVSLPDTYIKEARRVLKPGGIFFVVTPDRSTRLFPGQMPWNRWHLHEYHAHELKELVQRHFRKVAVSGMTGQPGVVSKEIARTRKLRLVTLPFTYGLEAWRQLTLTLLKKAEPVATPKVPDFGEDAVWVADNVSEGINICIRATFD